MKAKLFVVVWSLLITVVAWAEPQPTDSWLPSDTLRIVSIEDARGRTVGKSIYVDGVKMGVGCRFVAKQEIKWGNGVKHIKLLNERENSIREVSAAEAWSSKIQHVFNYFYYEKGLWSKGSRGDAATMQPVLKGTFYLIGAHELVIPSSLIIDDAHSYKLTLQGGRIQDTFLVKYDPAEPYDIRLTKEDFKEWGLDVERGPYVFSVEYVGGGEKKHITNGFQIVFYED